MSRNENKEKQKILQVPKKKIEMKFKYKKQ